MEEFLVGKKDLERDLRTRLELRLAESPGFKEEELSQIEALDHRLFAKGFQLEKDDAERLRALAALGRVSLKPPSRITSHRPVIGKLIVLVKKLTWPLVAFHMKDTVSALEEFCSISVRNQAKLLSDVERLKRSGGA